MAAQYVKKIFALACEGYGTGKIAKKLNEENVPTPGQYKNQENPLRGYQDASGQKQGKEQYHILDGEGYWDCSKVRKILQNKVYLGIVVNGRNRVTEIGGSHFRQVPDEEQICVPDKHEAIISEQEFVLASEVIKNNGCQKGKKHTLKQESVLLGKLRCGYCKRSLVRINCTKVPCFTCKRAEYEENGECIHERLSEPELELSILECINQKLRQKRPEQISQEQEIVLPIPDSRQLKKQCMDLEKKRDSLKIEKQYLYEQYKRNQIERKTYINKVEALREKEKNLSDQIQQIQAEKESCMENQKSQKEGKKQIERLEKLTRAVLDEWVDTIYVYGKGQFEIIYK